MSNFELKLPISSSSDSSAESQIITPTLPDLGHTQLEQFPPTPSLAAGFLGLFASLVAPSCSGFNEHSSQGGFYKNETLASTLTQSAMPRLQTHSAQSSDPEIVVQQERPRSVEDSGRTLSGQVLRAAEKAITRPFRNIERLTEANNLMETTGDALLQLAKREALKTTRQEEMFSDEFSFDSERASLLQERPLPQPDSSYPLSEEDLVRFDPLKIHVPNLSDLGIDATKDRYDPIQLKVRMPSGRHWLNLARGGTDFSDFVNRTEFAFNVQLSHHDRFEATFQDGFSEAFFGFVHVIGGRK